MIPLIETVDGDNTRTTGEGVSKGGLFRDALSAGVKESIPDRGIFRPTWYKPPAIRVHHANLVMEAHAKEGVLRSDVPTGLALHLEPGGEGRVEEPREMSGGSEESDAATHVY
jgi:hypothetical protein